MDTPDETDLLLLAAIWKKSMAEPNGADEARMAALVDRHRQGKQTALSAEDAAVLIALLPVVERMEQTFKQAPVPEALGAAVDRYFRAEKAARTKTSATDTVVVRLRETLELVSATLGGMQPALVPVSATRRATPSMQKLNMCETVLGGGVIEYDILRSGEAAVMVSVMFKEIQGPLTVRLSESGRPISSQTVRETTGRIHFDGLLPGEYRLDLTGCCDRSFTLQLLSPME